MRAVTGLLLALIAAPLFAIEASNVLVVANENVDGSVEIAEYYAKLRGIPEARILMIKASGNEEITRDEFNRDIRDPVTEFVRQNPDILAIVPTRGVPLKVKETDTSNDARVQDGFLPGRDFASVDSELMLIRAGDYEIESAVENPWFESEKRLTTEDGVLVVSRLDGPTVEIAKALVEKAILAEALGCSGESLLDTRGPNLSGGYKERDDIMLKVGDAWKAADLPYAHDAKPEVVDLSTREETLHYYGWYEGTLKPAADVRFRTGGVAVHLHSFSASTIRRADKNWVGPLLSWGCTATYGTVYEPLTVGYPYENVFWDRLAKGFTFGEAGMAANRLLSWQSVFVGDPLYAPYADGHSETHTAYQGALVASLAPADDAEGVAVDVDELPLFQACSELLAARAGQIETLNRSDPAGALAAFNELRFLVKGMRLGDWIGTLSAPFECLLRQRFDAMKKHIKSDLTDTAEFEAVLDDWQGMPIHEELIEFRDELAGDQEKHAGKLLSRAERSVDRKRWLEGYVYAAEAAALVFAESSTRGAEIVKQLNENAEALESMKEQANKDLERIVKRAERYIEREDWERAARIIGREWRFYPDCEQRKKLAEFAGKIESGLSGAE